MNKTKNILVVVESARNDIKPSAFECVHAARSLADALGSTVVDALCFYIDQSLADRLVRWGADNVRILQNPLLREITSERALLAIEPHINMSKPHAIFFSATTFGKELAASLSARLNVGLVTDCVHINVGEQGDIVVRRPIYAGKAISHLTLHGPGPHILSLRQNAFRSLSVNTSRNGEIKLIDIEIPDDRLFLKVRETVQETSSNLDVTEARVIVSGGLGMQTPENFSLLEDLALVLNGAVGASRPVVDNGWRNYSSQIGQTGRTVQPDLYIACGISGAVQHLAGMSAAKCIVAINKDPSAPIFSVADYGIIGDAIEILPLLTKEFRRVVGSQA